MHATWNTIDEPAAVQRFDLRRHRRISGLFDLWLEPGPDGGLVVPTEPGRRLAPQTIADLVRRSGDAADDLRILTNDGARHTGLLSEVAGLLAHDVLVSPDGAEIRHHQGRPEKMRPGPLHAVPVDRVTGRPKNWIVIQPPDLATPLPGWFAVDHGLVGPRKGVVGLHLRDRLVLATRADFVARRATAHRLSAAADGLVTVAVTARAGGFLVGDYDGSQRVHSGGQFAALLGDLPLYGSDLRLWLTWPSDPDEQRSLAAQVQELAETAGATVWTPPTGGSAELADGRHDLRALDQAGEAAEWQARRPPFAADPPTLRATPDGLLLPRQVRPSLTVRIKLPPDAAEPQQVDTRAEVGQEKPEVGHETPDVGRHEPADPQTVTVAPHPRPALIVEGRQAPPYGPVWLPPRQQVNAEQFEAFVVSPVDAWSVADGVPTAELFLVAFLYPRSAPEGSRLLRVRIGPGGAIPMAELRAHLPARLQHRRSLHESYLLPAARLNRVFPIETYRVGSPGQLIPEGECTGGSLRIRCSSPARAIAGLPNDVQRWPTGGTRRAYALLPTRRLDLPRGWLRLYHQAPPVQSGRLLVELRVPRDRAIDVASTAEALAWLSRVSTQAERLRDARVELILGSRSYGRVRVRRVCRADDRGWRRVPQLEPGPLPAVLARLQATAPS